MTKIAIVIPKLFHGGGAEKVAIEQADIFRDMGHNVALVTFHSSDDIVNTHSFAYRENKLGKLLSMFSLPFQLRRYIRENKIDIVVSHTERANFVALLALRLQNNLCRVITVTHNYKYLSQLKHRPLIKWLYPYAYKNITVSQAIEERLENLYQLTNTQTIYNPFDFDKITLLSQESIEKQDQYLFNNNKITFINVGRLHKQKGQAYLISAFALQYDQNPNSQLLILGEGALRQSLQNQINELGMPEHIHLLGNKKNVFPYLKQSDCFVLTSLWEGLPTVLIEAMGTNIPIISSDCKSGPKEILGEDSLISLGDSFVAKLAEEISQVGPRKKTSYELDRFSKQHIFGKWEDFLRI